MKKSITIAALIGTAMLAVADVKELQINGSFESLDNNPITQRRNKTHVLPR